MAETDAESPCAVPESFMSSSAGSLHFSSSSISFGSSASAGSRPTASRTSILPGTCGLCVITIPASSYPYTITRFCLLLRHLRRESVRIGRHRASRLMRLIPLMGLQAIKWANHVWCADLTYIWFRQFGLPSARAGLLSGLWRRRG